MKTAEGVASAAGTGLAGGRVECRVWERHTCELAAACQPVAARLDKDVHWPGQIRELSAGGMGLILSRRFERGAVLVTELPRASGGHDTLLARVVHVTPFAGGRWLHGCAFCSRLSEDRVQTLLGRARTANGEDGAAVPHPEASQQPGTPDRSAAGKSLLLRGVILEGPTPSGGTVVLRLRELRLWGRWPLTRGTLLRVRLTTGGSTLPDVRVRVRSCEPRGECWVLRYELAKKPSKGRRHTSAIPSRAEG